MWPKSLDNPKKRVHAPIFQKTKMSLASRMNIMEKTKPRAFLRLGNKIPKKGRRGRCSNQICVSEQRSNSKNGVVKKYMKKFGDAVERTTVKWGM